MNRIKSLLILLAAILASALPLGAQVIWDMPGATPLITAAEQLSDNHPDPSAGGGLKALIDGDRDTFYHSDWHDATITENHYVQADLRQDIDKDLTVVYARRNQENNYAHPLKFRVEGSSNGTDWFTLATHSLPYNNGVELGRIYSRSIPIAGRTIRHLRFICTEDKGGKKFFALSELQVYDMNGHAPAMALVFKGEQYTSDNNLFFDSPRLSLFDATQSAWRSNGQTLKINMFSACVAGEKIVLVGRQPSDPNIPLCTKFKIRGSNNGSSFTWIADMSVTAGRGEWFQLVLPTNQISRGYRYLQVGSEPKDQDFGLEELRVYLTDRTDLADYFNATHPTIASASSSIKFEHTYGIADSRYPLEKYRRDGWVNGVWTKDKSILEKYNIDMPDYTYLTSATDSRIKEGKRQNAPTLVQEIIVLPGDETRLTPISDIFDAQAYKFVYGRWYDYTNDRSDDNLYFPHKAEKPYRMEAGHFTGSVFKYPKLHSGMAAVYLAPDNFTEAWIALDLSQEASVEGNNYNFDYRSSTLYEPHVDARYLFHLVNGRTFADENMSSVEDNKKYYQKERRRLMARAGSEFHIRLKDHYGANNDTRSHATFIRDGKYDYVRQAKPRAYKVEADGSFIEKDGMFEFDTEADYSGYEYVSVKDNTTMRPKPRRHRSLKCVKEKALEGTYIVNLEGCDDIGNDIMIGDRHLVLAQFEIHFVNEHSASLLRYADLMELHPEQSAEELEKLWGEPKVKLTFDNYYDLYNAEGIDPADYFDTSFIEETGYKEDSKNNTEYLQSVASGRHKPFRFLWPLPPGDCSYVAYNKREGAWNRYGIFSDWFAYPSPFASKYGKVQGDDATVYDIRHLTSGGEDDGAFYAIDASGDPGEIVNRPIDGICSGSTLYVSGWMDEEKSTRSITTANMVIEFKAVDLTGKEHVLHSYVTGNHEPENTSKYTDAPKDYPYQYCGRWWHFYYSFIVNFEEFGITTEQFGPTPKFIISFENNCCDSHGADYGVDDIRVYVAHPLVYAHQTTPLCVGEKSTEVKIEVPYEVILASMGYKEPSTAQEGQNTRIYYSFLRKKDYYDALADGKTLSEAFNAAVVTYDYTSDLQTHGLWISTHSMQPIRLMRII